MGEGWGVSGELDGLGEEWGGEGGWTMRVEGVDEEIHTNLRIALSVYGIVDCVILVSFAAKHCSAYIDEPAVLKLHTSCSVSICIRTSMQRQ